MNMEGGFRPGPYDEEIGLYYLAGHCAAFCQAVQ